MNLMTLVRYQILKKQLVQIFQLYGLLLFDIRLLMVLFFHFVTKQISSTCDLQV